MHLGDILDILNERSDSSLSLNDAMSMARDIMSLHTVKVREANSEGYDLGYKSGHEVGQSLVTVPTPQEWQVQTWERCYELALRNARENVSAYVASIGEDRKIQVIKKVRSEHGLGLRDAKDIVDAFIQELRDRREEEDRLSREELDRAQRQANYSDEPPF